MFNNDTERILVLFKIQFFGSRATNEGDVYFAMLASLTTLLSWDKKRSRPVSYSLFSEYIHTKCMFELFIQFIYIPFHDKYINHFSDV